MNYKYKNKNKNYYLNEIKGKELRNKATAFIKEQR